MNGDALPLRRDFDTLQWYGLVGLFAYLLYALGAATPYLKSALGLSDFQVGLHSSAFALGVIVSGLVGDRLAARFPPALLLLVTAGGEAAAGAVVALAPYLGATLAAASVMGLCGSLMLAVVNASIVKRHPRHSERVLTEAQVAASICSLATALLLGLSVKLGGGWQPVLVLPLAAVLAAAMFRLGRRRSAPSQQLGQGSTQEVHAEKRADNGSGPLPLIFWLRWAVAAAVIAIEFALVFWGPTTLRTRPGLDAGAASAAMAFFICGMLAGRILGSFLLARVKGTFLLPAGAILAAAGAVVLRGSSSLAISSAALLAAGLGVANLYSIAVDAAIRAVPGRAVQAAARCSFAFGVALLAGPPLLGALADHLGILEALWTVTALGAAAALLHMIAAWFSGQETGQRN